jgi:RES domain-containing protein
MRLHRIGAQHFNKTAANAFSGLGGVYGSGRWHHPGKPIIYTASSLSLATLEILVHINRSLKIEPYVSWIIDVPDSLIATPSTLPVNWASDIEATRAFGDEWLAEGADVAIRVPSVIVKTEDNVLLNPLHSDYRRSWVVRGPHPVVFDPRHIDPSTIK